MDRLDYYFRQLVTEGELDLGFDQVQDRIETAMSAEETGFEGICKGANVTESSPPALTVEVSGDAVGFTPEGKRVAWASAEQVDVSQDKLGAPTAVTTPGNSKILSVFVEFDEDLQDPRLDGNSLLVYFKRIASHNIYVLQSAEAVSPVAPALLGDALLLCDINLAFGQTTVINANIDLTRRQDYFRRPGTNKEIVRGRIDEVVADLLDFHNELIDNLASNAAGFGGSLVGLEAVSGTPTGGSALGFPATDVQDAFEDIVSDLTGAPGATKIGAAAKSGSNVTLPTPLSLNATHVDDQISDLLDFLETVRNTPFAATAVSYVPHDYIVATNVQNAIDELIDDLQATTGGPGSGAYEIGYRGITQALHSTNWTHSNIAAGPVETALDTLAFRSAGCLQRGGDTSAGYFQWTNADPFLFSPASTTLTHRFSNTSTLRANLTWNFSFEGSDGAANPMVVTGAGNLSLSGDISATDVGLSGNFGMTGNVVSDLVPSGPRDLGSAANYWAEAYVTDLFVQELNTKAGNAFIEVDTGSGESFRPKLTGITNLGEGGRRWLNSFVSGTSYAGTFSGTTLDVSEGQFDAVYEPIIIDHSDSLGRTKYITREDSNASRPWADIKMGFRFRQGTTTENFAEMDHEAFWPSGTGHTLGLSTDRWDTVFCSVVNASGTSTMAAINAATDGDDIGSSGGNRFDGYFNFIDADDYVACRGTGLQTPSTATDLVKRTAQNAVLARGHIDPGGLAILGDHFNMSSVSQVIAGIYNINLDVACDTDSSIIVTPNPGTITASTAYCASARWVSTTQIRVGMTYQSSGDTTWAATTIDFFVVIIGRPDATP